MNILYIRLFRLVSSSDGYGLVWLYSLYRYKTDNIGQCIMHECMQAATTAYTRHKWSRMYNIYMLTDAKQPPPEKMA